MRNLRTAEVSQSNLRSAEVSLQIYARTAEVSQSNLRSEEVSLRNLRSAEVAQ
jgi:hypothetical protein